MRFNYWEKIVNGHFSQTHLNAVCSTFLNKADREKSEIFAEKWFESLETVEKNQHRDYFETYFRELSPRFLGR